MSAKAAGIATTLTNSTSFTTPVGNAMNAGIPVLSYNADGDVSSTGVPDIGTNRLCYVGQALFTSGQQLGERIKQVVPTPGDVVIFIATPGQANIQPRFDGAASVLKPLGYTVAEIATGANRLPEQAAMKAVPARAQAREGRVRRGRRLERRSSARRSRRPACRRSPTAASTPSR